MNSKWLDGNIIEVCTSMHQMYTFKRISNWTFSFYHILGKYLEKIQITNYKFKTFLTSLKFDHGNKLKLKGLHGKPYYNKNDEIKSRRI